MLRLPFPGRLRRVVPPDEDDAIVRAIAAAEQGSRWEIRVHLERRCRRAEPLERAAEVYGALGMHATVEGTGVLLYVAVDDRVACVYAGSGIHGAAEPAFWQEVVDAVARGFAEGRAAAGIVDGVTRIGELARRVAPADDVHGDELPNQVSRA